MIAISKNKLLSLFVLALHDLNEVAIVMSSRITSEDINVVQDVDNHRPHVYAAGDHYEVHIVDNLPSNSPKLFLHCASKHNELGNHTLSTSDDFHWQFRMLFFLTTMFFCRFRWSSHHVAHEVFNSNLADNCFGVKGMNKS